MSSRPANLFILGGGALMLACVAGLAIVLLPLLPFQHQWARQRWEQRRPRHYEVEASWANGWNFGHVLVEIHDNKIVKSIDLDTGQPLSPHKMSAASYFVSIDKLFDLIAMGLRPASNWRTQLARYHPLLADRLSPCATPLPNVQYDTEFGYPTSIVYYDTSCIETDFNLSNVKIRQLRPLP